MPIRECERDNPGRFIRHGPRAWRCRASFAMRLDRVYSGHDPGRRFREIRPGEVVRAKSLLEAM